MTRFDYGLYLASHAISLLIIIAVIIFITWQRGEPHD